MSTNVTKVSFRMPLPALETGYGRRALAFFEALAGTPECVDRDDDGTITYFNYPNLCYVKEPVTDVKGLLRPVQDIETGMWAVELIIGIYNHDRYDYQGFNTDVLNGHALSTDKMNSALLGAGLSQQLIDTGKIYAYTWYNGSDEPVHVE